MPVPEQLPLPPDDAGALLAWAALHHVEERLDDVFIGNDAPPGTAFPGRPGERLTYRDVLIAGTDSRRGTRHYKDLQTDARELLHRMATLTHRARAARAWMDEHGRDPRSHALAGFLEKLRGELRELSSPAVRDQPRAVGTYDPVAVDVIREPVPMLRYRENLLTALHASPSEYGTTLLLLGWSDGPLRWTRTLGNRSVDEALSVQQKQSALQSMIDFLRDPRQAEAHEILDELLDMPTWRFALGTLDHGLARLAEASAPQSAEAKSKANTAAPRERVGFRLSVSRSGDLTVDPVIQRSGPKQVFSRGAVVAWHKIRDRPDLTPADVAAYRAFSDRFVAAHAIIRRGRGGPSGWVFRVLRALIDHPGVFLESAREDAGDGGGTAALGPPARPDIRLGRLRLHFAGAPDGSVTPYFELLGVRLSPGEVDAVLDDEHHAVLVHRPPGQAPQLLLAQLTPEAVALVQALALAPARFPPDAHDALATRLESLQEAVDIEFPSQWTRTIGPADGRTLARLELLASGAVQVRLAVRPVPLGPVFAPGEGPALVLEGQGRERHGARRDLVAERSTGGALAERLRLEAGAETAPWCWRVEEGDAAFDLVATLKDLANDDRVVVEWADEERLLALGGVGRADMRLKVADRHDWLAVEGGAVVKGRGKGRRGGKMPASEIVPLADLLAAIREERRYVRVGAHGFVRIEDSLREALARAEGALLPERAVLQISFAAHDALVGLVEDESQVEASAAFTSMRRRMKEGAAITARIPPNLEAKLRPYQLAGVEWMTRLSHWGAGAILADEMGLGKTIQTLAVLCHRASEGPALVVAPTSVVGNWVDEAARFAPELKVRLYRGPDREGILKGLGSGDLVITSYAIATMDGAQLGRERFASLVLDEAQAIKNATTERSKALRSLSADWRLGLTGTPIENHLGELWSLLRVISPGLLGSWEQFRGRYAVPIEKFGDDLRRRSLSALLRPFMLRRMKAEVARDLPARTEVVRMVSLSDEEKKLYEELRLATLEEIANTKKDRDRDGQSLRFVLLAALTRLRQLCCHPRLVYPRTNAGSTKTAYLLRLLEELREDGHKALVFSQFRSFLELLEPRLTQHGFRVLVLDGTTPAEVRERRIAAFQAGEADLFLISLKAGGFGLNLTAADTVIHLDPWWNPAVEDQATARAHRMGQQRPVTAVRLVAQGTIEEAVLGLHAAKRALAAAVLEGADIAASLGTDELMDLIRRGSAPEHDSISRAVH